MNKRLIIISADPLSQTYSNGKTLESMIGNWDKENVAQIYFNPYFPSSHICEKYFRITDSNIISSHFKKNRIGEYVNNACEKTEIYKESSTRGKLKKIPFARVLRELIWKMNWDKVEKMKLWLDEFAPEVILFMGGDLLFMYSLCLYIVERYHIPIIFQVTDDYLDRRCGLSLSAYIMRNKIRHQFKKMVLKAAAFITIGDYMREVYLTKFGVDSVTFMNAVEIPEKIPKYTANEKIELLYAGSLYFGREKILLAVRNSLERLNKIGIQSHLSIYTSSTLDKEVESKLNDGVVSSVCGYVSQKELQKRIHSSDVLVFVEDFSKKNIDKTRLSVSTKLPEYMVSGRSILAVGPKEVGSMKYVQTFACVCNSLDDSVLDKKVEYLLTDTDYRKSLSEQAFEMAVQNHSVKRNRMIFAELIEGVFDYDNTSKNK